MPSEKRPGTKALYVEIRMAIWERLARRCQDLDRKIVDEVELALLRHLDYPPAAQPSPPLPTTPKRPRGRPRKKSEIIP